MARHAGGRRVGRPPHPDPGNARPAGRPSGVAARATADVRAALHAPLDGRRRNGLQRVTSSSPPATRTTGPRRSTPHFNTKPAPPPIGNRLAPKPASPLSHITKPRVRIKDKSLTHKPTRPDYWRQRTAFEADSGRSVLAARTALLAPKPPSIFCSRIGGVGWRPW